ncbi:hypothetical protein CLV98_10340 [Dyadobacter jejuensis]|uniref:Uncharacterized protein n=1 Tax=Dyadobacter jejuensis TaxID=1082580 RepID=A0A316ALJ7_9BACT|nr:hypothetical protein CLV98_10340 [Dyadobacter jejuensis]
MPSVFVLIKSTILSLSLEIYVVNESYYGVNTQ